MAWARLVRETISRSEVTRGCSGRARCGHAVANPRTFSALAGDSGRRGRALLNPRLLGGQRQTSIVSTYIEWVL